MYNESQMTWKKSMKLKLNWINFYSGHVCSSAAEWHSNVSCWYVINLFHTKSVENIVLFFIVKANKHLRQGIVSINAFLTCLSLSKMFIVFSRCCMYVIVVIRTHNNASEKTWKNFLFSSILYPCFVLFYCCSTSQWG
jgi:hypothetical protein